MYIPKHCPECGEGRHLFVETKPSYIGCQKCGMEFNISLTYDVDAPTNNQEKSCDNCCTKDTTGCSWHTAEDCGTDYKLWTSKQ